MMVEIPSTGTIGIDIAIVLVTGGAVTTWLSLFLDNLSKKRQEYIQITEKKISKITQSEKVYMQMASYLLKISNKLIQKQRRTFEKRDYQESIFYILKYLHLWRKFFDDIGFIQLDNMYSEEVISDLFQYLITELQRPPLGLKDMDAIRDEFSEEISFETFVHQVQTALGGSPKANIYDAFMLWLRDLNAETQQDIIDRGQWCSYLMSLELNLAYKIFYGDHHIKNYYREHCLPSELLSHLETNYPYYYERLEKLNLI